MGSFQIQENYYPYDNLIFDTKYVLDVKHVKIKGGQGELKRGTLIAFVDFDGSGHLYDETGTPNCILINDIDTGNDAGKDFSVSVYRSGHFTRQCVIIAKDKTLTKIAEHELEKQGIYLSTMVQISEEK